MAVRGAGAERLLAVALFEGSRDLAEACLEHPFVRGIADGTLEEPRFRCYVAQDAYFLEAFARAYALAAGRSPDRDGLRAFHALVGGVLEELELHRDYAARWGIDLVPAPLPAASAYVHFLLAAAALEPSGHVAAAMAPCMRLYAFLGQRLARVTAASSPYREWVETYADPEFEALAKRLEGLLERYGGDRDRIGRLYREAMRLELQFFESVWAAGAAR